MIGMKRPLPWGSIAGISLILAILLGYLSPLRILFTVIFVISFTIWCILPFVDLAKKKRKLGLDLVPKAFGLLAVLGLVTYILLPFIVAVIGGIGVADIPGHCAGYMLWGEGDSFCYLYSNAFYLGLFTMVNFLLLLISTAILEIYNFAKKR